MQNSRSHSTHTNRIFIIDGASFLYRAFYALKPMQAPYGAQVGAVFGFCRMLKKLIDTQKPEYIAICWDSAGKTERHEVYADYKSTRQATPSDLHDQRELIQKFAHIIGIKQVAQEHIEADDLMYSLALDFVEAEFEVVLVTSDKDLGQAVGNGIVICDTFKDEILDATKLEQKYGFPLSKLPFYFALIGDSSDNIPGVRGIGPKTATELVKQFESLHQLYDQIDLVSKERTRALLLANKDNAFLSEDLFLLRYHELDISPDMCKFDPEQWALARNFFVELNFKSLLKELPGPSTVEYLSKQKGYQFVAITDQRALTQLCTEIKAAGACAIDTETDSLAAYQSQLVGISLCYQKGRACYIPVGHTKIENQLSRAVIMQELKPLLEDSTIKKYLHHAKFDELVLSRYGIELQGVAFDTMIAAGLVNNDGQRIGLKSLSLTYLQERMLTYEDVMTLCDCDNFKDVPLDLAIEYAASDAHQVLQLLPILQEKLRAEKQEELYFNIELPLIQTLYQMEKEGIIIDPKLIQKLNGYVEKYLERIRQDIITLLGPDYTHINLNSPRQIEEILFTKLGLTPTKKTAKKTGYSTDQEVLAELAKEHPVPALIIKYRELFKLKSTYLDTLPSYINPYTGRIHTDFSQTGTATGRLASSDPNLQNIPVESIVDDQRGEPLSIRRAFVAPEGELFISADYSQIELRVLAYFSQDKKLLDAFLHNEDIHARTAAGLFDVPFDQVSHAQRQLGKRINFSILYGLTPYGLSKDLGISYSQAESYIERYFAQYPQVSEWMKSVIEETKTHGYVTTYWGRRRYIPGIYERNKTLYDLAQRIAINTKAQGTAAEIMKIGMNRLAEHFKQNNSQARMVLQIHDELLITAPEKHVDAAQQDVQKILESVVSWNVPLVVTTRTGKNWHEVTK